MGNTDNNVFLITFVLKKMSINLKNIQCLAHCLMLQPMVIRNRIIILKEMGVKSIGLEHIQR